MDSNEEIDYRNKLNTFANSLNDKISILEARDRLLRLKRLKQTDLATAVAVVGTCPDMCPEFERYFREETNQVSGFEMDSNGRPDEYRMIKEYRRSGADQEEPLPHELRPIHVLNTTMDYLCTNVMDVLDFSRTSDLMGCGINVGDWYDFVWSRTRSIRKDITQQHLCDLSSVALTEKCARFHIHCSATLCEQDIKDFDPKINEENLSNCLQTLKDCYYDLSLNDIYCPNESEFRSYDIILHLSDTSILRDVHHYRKHVRDSIPVRQAVKALFAYQSNNYIDFFKIVDKCSYLMACLLHRYFIQVRQKAFKILRKSYTSNSSSLQEYPNHNLVDCLGFENNDELIQFCEHIGLECSHSVVHLVRGLNQNNTIKVIRSLRLVENKRNTSVGQTLYGSALPANPYKSTPVHNSFDSEGKLKSDAIDAMDQQLKANTTNTTNTTNTANTSALKANKFSFNTSWSQHSDETAIHTNDVFNIQLMDTISDTITKDLIESVTHELLVGICSTELENIRTLSLDQTICQIFSDILLTLTDDLIKDIGVQVIENEIDLKTKERQSIEDLSNQLSDEMIDELVVSQIKSICEHIYDICFKQLIEKQNNLLSNDIFNDLIDVIVNEISSDVVINAIKERESLVQLIRQRKQKRLEEKYFEKWKNLFFKLKRLKCLKHSFPAAPNWKAQSPQTPTNQMKYFCHNLLEENFEKSIEMQLLANVLLNNSIDLMVKEIASQVFELRVIQKENSFSIDYIQQKRIKRLQKKYFEIWRNLLLKRKEQRNQQLFPAAPNWSSIDAVSTRIKYTFSEIDSNFVTPIKRRREESDQQMKSEANSCSSGTHLKQLLNKEITESNAFTQKLRQSLEPMETFEGLNQSLILNEISCEEEDEDIEEQTIAVSETQTDQIKRLKRMLNEDKDYFSLQRFVDYLTKNSEQTTDTEDFDNNISIE